MYHVHCGVKGHMFQLCNLSDVKTYLKKEKKQMRVAYCHDI